MMDCEYRKEDDKNMRFLVIGLGSMGRRRIRNLQELGYDDIIGYDINEARRIEAHYALDISTFKSMETVLYAEPTVFLICTPPDHHRKYQLKAIELEIPFFTEASVINEGLLDTQGVKGIPSATMKFCPSIRGFKHWFDELHDVKAFKYSCKSWLPDWHPNERNGYYAFGAEVNGCKEMIPFELCWLVDIFGEIDTISSFTWSSGMFGKFDDYYLLDIRFKNDIRGLVEIDVISKEAGGGVRKIVQYRERDVLVNTIYANEGMYVNELKCFIDYINGKGAYPHSFEEDQRLLELLEAIEK